MKLFDKDDRYTEDAVEFDLQVYTALMPIFKEWAALGASPRTMAYIASASVFDVHHELLLDLETSREVPEGAVISGESKSPSS